MRGRVSGLDPNTQKIIEADSLGIVGRYTNSVRDAAVKRGQSDTKAGLFSYLEGMQRLALTDREGLAAYIERLAGWQLKAMREAKRHSSWNAPDAAYEAGCRAFLDGLLDPARSATFLESLTHFVDEIASTGAVKGLTQALLRMSCPGVPDLYQGTEYWDLSMVDPDNRRPVDFDARRASLASDAPTGVLLDRWRDGAIKQRLVQRVLACRREDPLLFARGDYTPLVLEGRLAQQFVAFVRRHARRCVLVIAPLQAHPYLRRAASLRLPPQALLDTAVRLPDGLKDCDWFDALEQRPLPPMGARLPLNALLDGWPLALLRGTVG